MDRQEGEQGVMRQFLGSWRTRDGSSGPLQVHPLRVRDVALIRPTGGSLNSLNSPASWRSVVVVDQVPPHAAAKYQEQPDGFLPREELVDPRFEDPPSSDGHTWADLEDTVEVCHFVSSIFEGYVPKDVEYWSRHELLLKPPAADLRGSYSDEIVGKKVIIRIRDSSSEETLVVVRCTGIVSQVPRRRAEFLMQVPKLMLCEAATEERATVKDLSIVNLQRLDLHTLEELLSRTTVSCRSIRGRFCSAI